MPLSHDAIDHERSVLPHTSLDADTVRAAYARWAGIYDAVFGGVSAFGRRRAVAEVNKLEGTKVLEVGVGTGLALPYYDRSKVIVGVDLSAAMLSVARRRVRKAGLENIEALIEVDAEHTGFANESFDIAVAMFVASVVPNPRNLLAEMRRVVRPGGYLLFVNHFAARKGPRWWVEKAMAPASHRLGWHPDFAREALFLPDDMASAQFTPVPPLGLFSLVALAN